MLKIARMILTSQGLIYLINFGSNFILARLLGPVPYGLFVAAVVIRDLIGLPLSFMFNLAIMRYRKEWIESSEAVTAMLIIGGLVYMLLVSTVIAFGGSITDEVPIDAVFILSGTFVLGTLTGPYSAGLQIMNKYGSMVRLSVLSTLLAAGAAVGLALISTSVYPLVIREVILTIVSLIGSAVILRIWFRPRWEWQRMKTILGFSTYLWLCRMAEITLDRIDRALISQFKGSNILGNYHQARYWSEISQLSLSPLSGFFFEQLTQPELEPTSKLEKGQKLIVFFLQVGMVTSLTFFLFGKEILILILGPKWIDAAEMVRYFTPYIGIFPLINILKTVAYTEDMALRVFISQCVQIAVVIVVLIMLLQKNIMLIPFALGAGAFTFLLVLLLGRALQVQLKIVVVYQLLIGYGALGAMVLLNGGIVGLVILFLYGCFVIVSSIKQIRGLPG